MINGKRQRRPTMAICFTQLGGILSVSFCNLTPMVISNVLVKGASFSWHGIGLVGNAGHVAVALSFVTAMLRRYAAVR